MLQQTDRALKFVELFLAYANAPDIQTITLQIQLSEEDFFHCYTTMPPSAFTPETKHTLFRTFESNPFWTKAPLLLRRFTRLSKLNIELANFEGLTSDLRNAIGGALMLNFAWSAEDLNVKWRSYAELGLQYTD